MECCASLVGETSLPKQWGYTGVATRQTEMSRCPQQPKQQKISPTNEAGVQSGHPQPHASPATLMQFWKLGLVWAQAAKTRNQTTRSTSHRRLSSEHTRARQGQHANGGFLCSQPKATATANDAASDVVEQKAHGTTRGHACATMQTLQCASSQRCSPQKQKPSSARRLCTSILTPN